MRILYINDELATADGSNYHALGIWINLKKQLGEENVRAFPSPKDGSGTKVNHNGLGFRKTFKFPLQLVRIVRKKWLSHIRSKAIISALEEESFSPTHILCRTTLFDTTALKVANHFHAKLVTECNAPMYYEHIVLGGLPLPKAIKAWEKKMLFASDFVYTVSEVCRDMLCAEYGISREKFLVIPNGFDENTSMNETDRKTIRENIRHSDGVQNKFVVIFVGSLKKWHGIDALCALAEKLEAYPKIHFYVIGDGEEHQQIEDYVSTHTNLSYKGKLPHQNMEAYLYAADLGILPYHKMEHFYFSPLKLFDTIGAGLPFIGTSQGQIESLCTELLDDSFLLEDCNVDTMAKKILTIAENEELHHSMQVKISVIRSQVTWQARVETLLSCIK